MTPPLRVEISVGELADKLSILAIKSEHLESVQQLANVRAELAELGAAWARHVQPQPGLDALCSELRDVNERLWEIEDQIRAHEADGDFGAEFIALARSVYRTNDRRAELKRAINTLCGSRLVEEKSYAEY